jgi:hypothetical protein
MSNVIHLNPKVSHRTKRSRVTQSGLDAIFPNTPRISYITLNVAERRLLDFIGYNDDDRLLAVATRDRGITSSGIAGNSHKNVFSLVQVFGGSQVMGLAIDTSPHNAYAGVYAYFCWKTPEGELIDVTDSDFLQTKFLPLVTYNKLTLVTPKLMFAHFKPDGEKPFFIGWREIGHDGLIEHESCYDLAQGAEVIRKNIQDNLIEGCADHFSYSDEDLDNLFQERSAFTAETISEIRRRKQEPS